MVGVGFSFILVPILKRLGRWPSLSFHGRIITLPLDQHEVTKPGLRVPHLSPGDRWGSFCSLAVSREKWCARRDSNSRSAFGGFPPRADSSQLSYGRPRCEKNSIRSASVPPESVLYRTAEAIAKAP